MILRYTAVKSFVQGHMAWKSQTLDLYPGGWDSRSAILNNEAGASGKQGEGGLRGEMCERLQAKETRATGVEEANAVSSQSQTQTVEGTEPNMTGL